MCPTDAEGVTFVYLSIVPDLFAAEPRPPGGRATGAVSVRPLQDGTGVDDVPSGIETNHRCSPHSIADLGI